MADVIDGRGVFRQTQRLAQRQDLNPGPDLDVFGARGDRARDGHRHRAHRALGRHVDLGQPDGVETPAFGGVDQFKGILEGRCLGRAWHSVKLVEDPELHGQILPSSGERAAENP